MLKKYFTNPSLLFLIAGNLYCIWYYENNPAGFVTVVWIYWIQSIIIGLFNFFDLLTIKNYDSDSFKMNNAPLTKMNQGCAAWFFLVHYGFFHLGYCIFLLIQFGVRTVDKNFLLLGVAAFFAEAILGFIKQKRMERYTKFKFGTMFFLPYLRIVPMHLMILIPAFLGIKPSIVFLLLKMGADILSYIFYQRLYSGSKTNDAALTD